MRNALVLAAGLTAIKSASAAYDATICGKENKYTSADYQFICKWNNSHMCASCFAVYDGGASIHPSIHPSETTHYRILEGAEADLRDMQSSPTRGIPLETVLRVYR